MAERNKRLPIEIWGEPQTPLHYNRRLYEVFENTQNRVRGEHATMCKEAQNWGSIYVLASHEIGEEEQRFNVLGPLSPELIELVSQGRSTPIRRFAEPLEGQTVYGYEITNGTVSREQMEGVEWPIVLTNGFPRAGEFPEIEALVGYFENEQNFPTLLRAAEIVASNLYAEFEEKMRKEVREYNREKEKAEYKRHQQLLAEQTARKEAFQRGESNWRNAKPAEEPRPKYGENGECLHAVLDEPHPVTYNRTCKTCGKANANRS